MAFMAEGETRRPTQKEVFLKKWRVGVPWAAIPRWIKQFGGIGDPEWLMADEPPTPGPCRG